MKKLIIVCLLVLVIILTGCSQRAINLTDNQVLFTAGTSVPNEVFKTNIPRYDPDLLPGYSPDVKPILPPKYSVPGLMWESGDLPAQPISGSPEFISHKSLPQGKDDPQLFEDAKCGYSDNSNYLDCSFTSPLAGFNCGGIKKPLGIGANLDPQFPFVAVCHKWPDYENDQEEEFIYRAGCMGDNVSYIFLVDGEYQLVNSAEKMQLLFAPITSPQEAITYAHMLTGLELIYCFPSPGSPYILYYSEVVEATHAVELEDGYLINMYHSDWCGCDTFLTSQVDVFVSHDGVLEWRDAKPTYLEISEGLCVD